MNRRKILALLLSIITVITFTFPVSASTGYSSNWKQDGTGKWYVQDVRGNIIKNCWFCDDYDLSNVKWYVLGPDGFMVEAPLILDKTGTYYSLETSHTGSFGMMRDKSGIYDGVNIVINEIHNGTFGAIMNQPAINALEQKYGVTKIDIDNSNIAYASKMIKNVSSGSSGSSSRVRPVTSFDIKIPAVPGTYKYGAGTLVVTADSAEYTNLSGTAQNIKLTSNGKDIVINAPLDEVKHYGTADSITVKAIADASYYGHADADSLEVNAGHLVINSKIGEMSVNAEKDVDIDVNKDAVIPSIEVDSVNDKSVDLTVGGDVQIVKSSIGSLTMTVEPTAKQTPKLEFLNDDAVAAYERRMQERLKESPEIPVYLTYNGKTETYKCRTRYTESFGTEVIEQVVGGFGEGEGRTFEGDVIVDGDFGKIRFVNCSFKGNIINRGSESTIVQFVLCTFDESSECRLENNGRKITIDDLVSKFMFIATDPINVVCPDTANGSVVSAETSRPIIYNGVHHTIRDAEYYVDQRPAAFTTAVQAYEGQAAGIYYYGEFNSLEGRKEINLSVYDEDEKTSIYRAYIGINDVIIPMDGLPKSNKDVIFSFASPSDASIREGDLYVKAPYNRVIFDGFNFEGTISVEGLYADITFKHCNFNNQPVVIKSPEVKITFTECSDVPDQNTEKDIEGEYYSLPDGPVE